MPYVSPFTPSTSFFFMCQKVLPLVYDDSLSYYEVLCKMRDYINKDIEKYNELGQAFNELVDYINDYLSDENIRRTLEPVIEQVVQDMIGIASADSAGMVKVGTGLSITEDGTLNNVNPTPYTLPSATTTTKGGVAVGEGLHLATDGYTLVNDNPTPYVIPAATAENLGGIKTSTSVMVDNNGVATVPNASTTVEGIVKYTAPIFKNESGQISVNYATASTSGVIRAGNGVTVDASGTLAIAPATSNTLGGVKAGAGVSISQEGTISVTSGGVADSVEWANVLDKPSTYPCAIATSSTIGGVKTGTGSTTGIDVDSNGGISINATYMSTNAATPASVTAVSDALSGKVNTTDVIDIEHGGTGQITAALARNALGLGNTTGPVPVANGGTGASDASTARTNLGLGTMSTANINDYVAKTGGTMTGALKAPNSTIYNANAPMLEFAASTDTSTIGGVWEDTTTRRTAIRQIHANGFYEDYILPANTAVSESSAYDLLSSKVTGSHVFTNSSELTAPHNTLTNIATITLPAGVWIVQFMGLFASDPHGTRQIGLGGSIADPNMTRYTKSIVQASDGGDTEIAVTTVLRPETQTTYYLNVIQTSGSTLSVIGGIDATRLV